MKHEINMNDWNKHANVCKASGGGSYISGEGIRRGVIAYLHAQINIASLFLRKNQQAANYSKALPLKSSCICDNRDDKKY